MSVDPKNVIRVTPPTGSDHDLAINRDHTTGVGLLTAQDLSVTTSGRLGVWMGHTMIVGAPADHGEVADEAAMLALHDWSDDPHARAVYHYVAPGDSCTRTDDPGYRWHCLSGHGRYLTDWERRPLVAPIAALEARADALEIELDGKADATHTHPLSELTPSGAATGDVATFNGTSWVPLAPSAGGSITSDSLITAAVPAAWFKANAGVEEADGDPAEDTDGVARWLDQSGNGNHLVQGTASMRPVYRTAQRGTLPVVRFDGSDDYLICSAFAGINLANCTVVWVGVHATSAEYGRMIVIGASGSGNDYAAATRLELEAGDSSRNYIAQINSTQSVLSGTRPAPAGCYHARIARSTLIAGVDDHTYGTAVGVTTSTSAAGLLIGAAWYNGAIGTSWGQLAADVYEVAVFGRALGNAELGQIVAALRKKWSL